jgi:HSP20 family protein
MSNLQQVREGLTKAWDTITIGWRELRELAGDALTRFHPRSSREVSPAEERAVVRGEKKLSRAETFGHYYVTERAYGRFERDQAAGTRRRHNRKGAVSQRRTDGVFAQACGGTRA